MALKNGIAGVFTLLIRSYIFPVINGRGPPCRKTKDVYLHTFEKNLRAGTEAMKVWRR